jgi:hemolysin III
VPLGGTGHFAVDWASVETRNPTAGERCADTAVHALGITLGLLGSLVLVAYTLPELDAAKALAVGLYVVGLMAMLGCSALYHLTRDRRRRPFFRRLDHAAIFLMIAGSYSPFTLVALGGPLGRALFAFVWAAAVFGMIVKLGGFRCPEWLSIAAYLALGWTALGAFGPLTAGMAPASVLLLTAGGLLYSLGVVFHLWARLPYHNAIWHGLVVLGAACQWGAVLRETALT